MENVLLYRLKKSFFFQPSNRRKYLDCNKRSEALRDISFKVKLQYFLDADPSINGMTNSKASSSSYTLHEWFESC